MASVARTLAGVQQAAVFRDAIRRRDHVTVVAAGAGGHILDDDELAHLRAFLAARVPPGVTLRVLAHRRVPVRARLLLRVGPGSDPLAAMATVRRRLGAAPPAPGEQPGLLSPERSELGADVHASDVYGALGDVAGIVSAHLEELHRVGSLPSGPPVAVATQERIEVPDDAVAAWAPPDAGADEGLVLAWQEAGES